MQHYIVNVEVFPLKVAGISEAKVPGRIEDHAGLSGARRSEDDSKTQRKIANGAKHGELLGGLRFALAEPSFGSHPMDVRAMKSCAAIWPLAA
jgi:hypothetical protein